MALVLVTVAGRRIRKRISQDLMDRLAGAIRMVAIAMASLLFITKCILPMMALAAKLKIHTAAASILSTQPFLFLILNSMIVAILAPSGLFKIEEPPAAPPPLLSTSALPEEEAAAPKLETPPESPPETPLEPSPNEQKDSENLPEDIPPAKPKAKRIKSSSARVLKRNQVHQSQVQTQVQQMELIPIDESNRENIPPSWGVNNVAAADACESTNSLKDEDFKHFIDSYIARARHQMMFQEQMEIAAERAARQGASMR